MQDNDISSDKYSLSDNAISLRFEPGGPTIIKRFTIKKKISIIFKKVKMIFPYQQELSICPIRI